ncbi:hypothetical protein IT570_06650 [Candidatus Sumerlaeota bacterium]|nr:hypothetical protein [Candidatus Sumerlaeota bacterium]
MGDDFMEVSSPPPRIDDRTAGHLNLLAVFQYVLAGLQALCGCFPIIHVIVGGTMLLNGSTVNDPVADNAAGGAQAIGGIFMVVGLLIIVISWVVAGLMAYAARCLQLRKNWLLCTIVAGLLCLSFPFGTAIGVLTLINLFKPEVKWEFENTRV